MAGKTALKPTMASEVLNRVVLAAVVSDGSRSASGGSSPHSLAASARLAFTSRIGSARLPAPLAQPFARPVVAPVARHA
jgi:hypothetical protein